MRISRRRRIPVPRTSYPVPPHSRTLALSHFRARFPASATRRSPRSPERMTAADPIGLIHSALDESARVKLALRELAPGVLRVSTRIADAFRDGKRLYACGNGGSACDAMHLVEELVARYKRDRPGLPAHHLLDAPTLTCWSNDYEFATAFRRQVEAMVRAGDVLVAISTSGSSPNVVAA